MKIVRHLPIGAIAAASLIATEASAATIPIVSGAPTVNVAAFDVQTDRFLIDAASFGVAGDPIFQNVLAADGNVADDVNVIILQNSDDDANDSTVFNARSAATLIAGNTDSARAGFFVYFNSALNINRLVFTPNLDDALAALTILAALNSPVGVDAIAQLPTFTNANFEFAEVPLPAAAPLFLAALAGLGVTTTRRRKKS